MTTVGTVRAWHSEQGWGVIDSTETPGGCWTHFSNVLVSGYAALQPGQAVNLDWERANQDGYHYRATRAWPMGAEPLVAAVEQGSATNAYRSKLTIRFDGERN